MLVIVLILIAVVVALLWQRKPKPAEPPSEIEPPGYPVPLELRAIRRRLEVAWFKHEVNRDAAQAGRELRDELRRLDKNA